MSKTKSFIYSALIVALLVGDAVGGQPSTASPCFPIANHHDEVVHFTENVFLLLQKAPASVTSWCRTTSRNRLVKGVPGSLHLRCLAVDVVPENRKSRMLILHLARRFKLLAIDEIDHVHLETVCFARPVHRHAA